MALNSILLKQVCNRLVHGMRVASMGYPDIIAHPNVVESILGARTYSLKYHDPEEKINEKHDVAHKIPKAESFFALLGAELDVYDIARHRGGEIICDLNEPFAVPEGYDIVIDIGTLEHCFNIGCAAINMASMLRKGGFIFHENPFDWANHGFWNINPTFYNDFYGQPGFKLHECWLSPKGEQPIKNIHRAGRFRYQGPEANNIAIAERTEILPVTLVVQGKYQKMIPAALAAPVAGDSGVKEAVNG